MAQPRKHLTVAEKQKAYRHRVKRNADSLRLDTEPVKICSVCGKKMIKHFSPIVLLPGPTMSYRWYCGCGHYEAGGIVRDNLPPTLRERWEQANSGDDDE